MSLSKKSHLTKSCTAVTALLMSFISLLPAYAQAGTRCTVVGSPQVSSALVSLENKTAASVYRRGEPVHVLLMLRPGADGVYLPNYFGPFMQTCSHGFASGILTPGGKRGSKIPMGCATSGPRPKVTFLKLNAGEVRTWTTELETKSVAPGHYCLYAEYISPEEFISTGLGLPGDKTLIAAGRITATPIAITIR